MRREALAWPWCTLAVRIPAALCDLGLYRRNAGLDLLEDKGMLLVIGRGCQLFRTPSKAGPIKSLEDLRQPLDAFVGVSVPGLEVINLLFQSLDAGCLFGHGENHSFQGLYIIRELDLGSRHGSDQSIFCRDPPAVSGT